MNAWMAMVRQRVPQWLAKESASAWIVAGTIACAGLGATLYTSAAHSQPPSPPVTTSTQAIPSAPVWPAFQCRMNVLGTGQSVCPWHFDHRWHHLGWGDGDWRRYGAVSPNIIPNVPPNTSIPSNSAPYVGANDGPTGSTGSGATY